MTFLVDWSSKMKTVHVFLLFKAAKKLYDDIFALICHIRHYTSLDVTIVEANIAISMLKKNIECCSGRCFVVFIQDNKETRT